MRARACVTSLNDQATLETLELTHPELMNGEANSLNLQWWQQSTASHNGRMRASHDAVSGASGKNLLGKAASTGPICTGFLEKKGGKRKNWQKRFFVLEDKGILRYYKNEKKEDEKGHVDLKLCHSVELTEDDSVPGLQLISDTRVFMLRACKDPMIDEKIEVWMRMLTAYLPDNKVMTQADKLLKSAFIDTIMKVRVLWATAHDTLLLLRCRCCQQTET